MYDRTIFERVQKNLNIEKIIFKVVQMKFLAMHITVTRFRVQGRKDEEVRGDEPKNGV